MAKYLSGALFSPSKSTLLRAIRKEHLISFPGLTTNLISKHLPKQVATSKGHLDQEFKNYGQLKIHKFPRGGGRRRYWASPRTPEPQNKQFNVRHYWLKRAGIQVLFRPDWQIFSAFSLRKSIHFYFISLWYKQYPYRLNKVQINFPHNRILATIFHPPQISWRTTYHPYFRKWVLFAILRWIFWQNKLRTLKICWCIL